MSSKDKGPLSTNHPELKVGRKHYYLLHSCTLRIKNKYLDYIWNIYDIGTLLSSRYLHLRSGMSNTIQSDVIESIPCVAQDESDNDIGMSPFIAALVLASDISNKCQLADIIRYVNDKTQWVRIFSCVYELSLDGGAKPSGVSCN